MDVIADSNHQTNVTSISYAIPYVGIDHAGGEYVRRHLHHLAKYVNIRLVSFSIEDNLKAKDRVGSYISTLVLVPRPSWGTTIPGRAIRRVFRSYIPLIPQPDLSWQLTRRDEVKMEISNSDVVEFQYLEYFHLAKFAHRHSQNVKLVGIIHDIVSERQIRFIATRSWLVRKTVGLVSIRSTLFLQRRFCNNMDVLLVFNENTKEKLRQLGVVADIEIARPPLHDAVMPSPENLSIAEANNVVFVGAFDRPENEQGAIWLIEKVWPIVKESVVSATLQIVGAHPSEIITGAANSADDVVVTGYVEDLANFYREAGVVVVPLLRGAGVKFKTLTAMLWGRPVVATPIGAEGIADDSYYLAVTSDPHEFANAIISGLTDKDTSSTIARRAYEWSQSSHDSSQFSDTIRAVYLSESSLQ